MFEHISQEMKQVEELIRKCVKTKEAKLAEYVAYFLKSEGKLLRPALVILSAKMGKYAGFKAIAAAAAVELLHMASLVHDDIIDGSPMRRNQPTVNVEYGIDSAVLLGDYFFCKAIGLFGLLGPGAVRTAVCTMQQMIEGEISEKKHRFNWRMSEDEYIKTIDMKTASLLRLSLELGARSAGLARVKRKALERYATCLGIAYQMRDDILDYFGGKRLGKPAGMDISNGVITLPWIYYFRSKHAEGWEQTELALDPGSLVDKLRDAGVFDASMERVNQYLAAAEDSLVAFPPSSSKRCLLKIASMLRESTYSSSRGSVNLSLTGEACRT